MRRRRFRYLVPLAATLGAVLLRLPFQPLLGGSVPYSLFYGAVAVSAWLGGFGPGLLAATLGGPIAVFWILAHGFEFSRIPSHVVVSLPLFLVVSITVSALFETVIRSRERLESERATLSTALLSIGEGIIVTDRVGRVAMMNAAAEQATGWTLAGARHRPGAEVFVVRHEEANEPAANPVIVALQRGQPVKLSTPAVLVARDGHQRSVEAHASPIRTASGVVDGVVLVFRDVTERRRAELDRDRQLSTEHSARVVSESANRMKDEFLAMLSHELRTPLNAIIGWSKLLRDQRVGAGQRDHALEVIHRNAEMQSRLIGDLLDVSKFATGQARFVLQNVDLGEVARDAADAVRLAAEAKSLTLEVTLTVKPALVVGDPDRLRQMTWNLLANAVKFTPAGGCIALTLTRLDRDLQLAVTDNGCGIAPPFLPYIFDRFTQADSSAARNHGGLGLGLALVRQIAEGHGGTVVAESAGSGQGAAFRVLLPALATSEVTSPVPRRTSPAESHPNLAGIRALVVDDSQDNREVAQLLLQHFGVEVQGADSVIQALAVFTAWRPDVVVADIGMPGEDGFALLHQLRERGAVDIPVIALTGYASTVDRERILAAGFVCHLPKPVDEMELAHAVASVTNPTPTVEG